ncbi:MAG: hypothetical protein ACQEQS_11245 [Thermodesulfobacteriota bacterium]
MKKTILSVSIPGLASTAAETSFSKPSRTDYHHLREVTPENNKKQIRGLTKKEEQIIEKEKKRFLKKTQPVRKKIFQKRTMLEQEVAKNDPNFLKIKLLKKAIYSLKEELISIRASYIEKLNNIIPGIYN